MKSILEVPWVILWDDTNEPEWTPWNKSLGDEETVHRYLNDNFMARFIPKKYTWNKDHPNYEQPAWFSRKKLNVNFLLKL